MIETIKHELDDRGVSPVIGVILMVAITVILAAVIGSFVLGIGGDVEQAPQASLTVEQTGSNYDIDITHQGGDTLDTAGDYKVIVDGSGVGDIGSSLGPGDTNTINNVVSSNGNYDVSIVHEPSGKFVYKGTVRFTGSQ